MRWAFIILDAETGKLPFQVTSLNCKMKGASKHFL
jgi:hypothetical protein